MYEITKKCLLLFIIAALFIFKQSVAYGYEHDGRKWLVPEVLYKINPNCVDESAGTPEKQLAAIQAAARAWNNEGNADFAFAYDGLTDATVPDIVPPPNGKNDIMFVQDDELLPDYVIARTSMWTYLSTPLKIEECDIAFNDAHYDFSTKDVPAPNEYDIWNVAAHELGHFLWLGHSSVAGSIMHLTGYPGDTEDRSLGDDDIAGIQAIYGADPNNTNPKLSDAGVTPISYTNNQEFTFYVKYEDADGDAPSVMQVFINDTPNDMELVDDNPANGWYSYTTLLDGSTIQTPDSPSFRYLGPRRFLPEALQQIIKPAPILQLMRTYDYYFYAEDGRDGRDILPVVENPPAEGPYIGPTVIEYIPGPGHRPPAE